jgi:hypothetical protein
MEFHAKSSLHQAWPWVVNIGLLGGLAALAPWQRGLASGQAVETPNGLCCGLTVGCGKGCTPVGSGSYEIVNHDYYSCQSYQSSLDQCSSGNATNYCGTDEVWAVPGCPGDQHHSEVELPAPSCSSGNYCGEAA